MAKYIPEQHITGELGVNKFHHYCLQHKPHIIFRSEVANDFGIDGEVELAAYNKDKKQYATGEIIKVQIKSTVKGSYIHKETETSFEFRASSDDIEYWNKHNLRVVLVVYDVRSDNLYAKKINQFDAVSLKTNVPILFDKTGNLLDVNSNDFRERFSTEFKSRVDYSKSERVAINIFRFSKLPRYLFEFKSNYTNPKEIFKIVSGDDVPNFKIVGDKIFTIYDVKLFADFKEQVIEYDSKKIHSFKKCIADNEYYNICIELINRQFQDSVRRKRIAFNRKYSRYFFMPLHDDFDEKLGRYRERIETYHPKKRSTATRKVVIYRTYGKDTFYRHFAFETKPVIINEELFMIINPQYFFTQDGKEPLANPETITKLTNYLTAREFNEQILNHIHFIYSVLSNRNGKIVLCELENSELEISKYVSLSSDFSIPLDYVPTRVETPVIQQNLFGDD